MINLPIIKDMLDQADKSDITLYIRQSVFKNITVSFITYDGRYITFLSRMYNKKYRYRDGSATVFSLGNEVSYVDFDNLVNPIIIRVDHMTILKIFKVSTGGNGKGSKHESPLYKVIFFGLNAQTHAKKSINEYRRYLSYRDRKAFLTRKTNCKIGLYDINSDRPYTMGADHTMNARSKDSVVFDYLDECVNHIIEFNRNSAMYDKYGVPHHTGILLYGEPGTGKTSIISAICHTLYAYSMDSLMNHDNVIRTEFYTLDVSDDYCDLRLSIADFVRSFTENADIHQNSLRVVIMEELDGVICGERVISREDEKNKKIDLLLKLLDGSTTPQNTVFIATTNNIDSLDPALIRKGRFDLQYELHRFDERHAKMMCDKLGVDYTILEGLQYPITPADLQMMIFEQKFKNNNPD